MTYEIHLTHRCNFKCPSCCVMCDVVNDPTSDLTMEEVKDIVDQINMLDKNIHCIRIMGGEPTLHPQCLEMCRYIKDSIKNAMWFELATNHTNNTLADAIGELGYRVLNQDGSTNPTETVVRKARKHWTLYISPKEAGLPINDPASCYALRDGCGIAVHKWRGNLVWSWCPNSPMICKLLQREEFMKSTLSKLLISDINKFFNEICVHCHCLCRNKQLAINTVGVVSNCFKEGLEAMKKYNKEVNTVSKSN